MRSILLLALVLTLTSCIEGDEELWLNRNGSGRIEATYRMPPAIMNRFGGAAKLQQRLEDAIKNEPSIRIQEISNHIDGAQVVFTLKAEFDDARSFISLPKKHLRDPNKPDKPSAEESFFGKMNLRLNGLTLKFDRNVDLSSILPAAVQDNAAMLGDSSFNFFLHLPAKPSTHNATSVSDNGTTLNWSFKLKDHVSTPMVLHTSLLLPLPWWAWSLATIVILLLAFGIFRLIISMRRKT